MSRMRSWLLIAVCVLLAACAGPGKPQATSAVAAASATLPLNPPAYCPITQPPDPPFTPPSPYPATPPPRYVGQFWYGTAELWTMLSTDGTWKDLPLSSAGYSQKVFWWRQGYDAESEPNPALTITGKRLDGAAPPLVASSATNAIADLGAAMLVGVEIPTAGCWEIAGHYHGHDLSFVVWVAP